MKLEMTWTRNSYGAGLTASWRVKTEPQHAARGEGLRTDATVPVTSVVSWQPKFRRAKQATAAA